MLSADSTSLLRHAYLGRCCKASLLTLFAAGVLVCTTAYAQALQQQSSKVATPHQKAAALVVDEVGEVKEFKEPVPASSVVVNGVVYNKLHKNTQKPSKVRRQSSSVYSVTQENIPGLEALKTPKSPQGADPDSPSIYLSGEHMDGQANSEVRALGRGQFIRDKTVVQGEELVYNRITEVITVKDDVRVNHDGGIFKGDWAEFHVPTYRGLFNATGYEITQTGAHGKTNKIDLLGKNLFTFHEATYSLCMPDEEGRLDWVLSAKQIDLDRDADRGVARNAVLRFKNTPILATPWISFPLSDKRKTGLLVPSFSISKDDGFSYSQPLYINLAPNYDATLTSMLMSKRGVGLGGEFRYLKPTFVGNFEGLYFPNDRLRRTGDYWKSLADIQAEGRPIDATALSQLESDVRNNSDRWGYSLQHNQGMFENLFMLGRSRLDLNLNRVSDHNYWEDFQGTIGRLNNRLLNNEGVLTTNNDGFNSLVRVQRWQTLQDPTAYIVPPYDRTQVRLDWLKEDLSGFNFFIMGDVTQFESDDDTRERTNAVRSVVETYLSYPIREAGYFIVPKVKLTSRHYSFKDGITVPQYSGFEGGGVDKRMKQKTITVPNFSLDTGLIFDKKARLFSKDYIQTLEPRVMYSYSPYQDQSFLPKYDSGQFDYNLATVYLENPYTGYDRLADVNMITAGVGTSWLKPETGQQVLSFNIAQRYRLSDQKVSIDEEKITSRFGDVLFNVNTELIRNWRFDYLTQYDLEESYSQRHLLMARWKPGPYRVMNFGYRMQRKSSEQLDISWQWPLGSPWLGKGLPATNKDGGRWFTVGRANYSLEDKKLVDGLLGVEYQSCCWIGRVVLERISTGRTKANTRLLFQLELSGLSRVGINPLGRLQDSINHYEIVRNERFARPNDFYLYD